MNIESLKRKVTNTFERIRLLVATQKHPMDEAAKLRVLNTIETEKQIVIDMLDRSERQDEKS